jgi:hypothetical protein
MNDSSTTPSIRLADAVYYGWLILAAGFVLGMMVV